MPPLSARLGSAARAAAGYAAGRIVATDFGQRIVQASAAFNAVPRAVPGVGQPIMGFSAPVDRRQQKLIGSFDALFGSTTYYAGPLPTAFTTQVGGGFTPQGLTNIEQQVRNSGIMTLKADADERVIMKDPHTYGVDRSRRVAVTGSTFLVRPSDDTEVAKANAKYIQAVCAGIDSFDRAWYELLLANASGFKTAEKVHKEDVSIRFMIGNKTLVVKGPHPRTILGVHNKHVQFNIGNDEPRYNMGTGGLVPIKPPDHRPIDAHDFDQFKYIYHRCAGDGQARMCGYMWPVQPMHMLKFQAIARLGVVLDLWGIPVPWGTVPMEIYNDDVKRVQHENIVAAHGRGAPILSTAEFKLQATPTPPNLDARGMHLATVGFADTAISKAVQGETLTTEVGGVAGSYALGGIQADTKEATVAQDAIDLANTLREWLFLSVLILNQDEICRAYNNAGINCTPDDILAHVPRPFWVIARSMTPQVQVEIAKSCVNDLGMRLDEAHFADSIGVVLATSEVGSLKGKPTEIKEGAKTVGAAAASEGEQGNPSKDAAPPASDGGGQPPNSPQAPSPQSSP